MSVHYKAESCQSREDLVGFARAKGLIRGLHRYPDPSGNLLGTTQSSIAEGECQEIGLVAFMFFFELLFSMLLRLFPSMFPLLTYSQSFFFLIC